MIRTLSAAFLLSAVFSASASAQQFGGVESILDDGPVRLEVEGINARDERLKTPVERELEANRVYDSGDLFNRSFGGDTHRNRAARSGGNIANIFNLFGSDDE